MHLQMLAATTLNSSARFRHFPTSNMYLAWSHCVSRLFIPWPWCHKIWNVDIHVNFTWKYDTSHVKFIKQWTICTIESGSTCTRFQARCGLLSGRKEWYLFFKGQFFTDWLHANSHENCILRILNSLLSLELLSHAHICFVCELYWHIQHWLKDFLRIFFAACDESTETVKIVHLEN